MRRALLLAFLCLAPLLPAQESGPPLCQNTSPRLGARYDLGLSFQYLYPNRLQSFYSPLLVYGLQGGIPLFGNTLQVQSLYGADSGLSLFTLELAYRVMVPTPFFNGFLMAGAHYLHYSYIGTSYDFGGPLAGMGMLFPIGQTFALSLLMKVYLPKQSIVSFGGGFTFRI